MEMQIQRPVIPKGYKQLVESITLAHVATIGPHGEPRNNPVWFGWNGEHVMFSQTRTRQKYRTLQRDPRVAPSIVDPETPYLCLEIRGEANHIEEDPNLGFINTMTKKYLGLNKYPNHLAGDERVAIFVRPDHTTQMGA